MLVEDSGAAEDDERSAMRLDRLKRAEEEVNELVPCREVDLVETLEALASLIFLLLPLPLGI